MNTLILHALETAIALHKNQLRKDGVTPYIVHPVATALILARAGADDNEIAAGLLHDTIEDTSYTSEALLHDFGPRVHELVLACTDNKTIMPWLKRKGEALERTAAVKGAGFIRAADVLSNMSDLIVGLKKFGSSFLSGFCSTADERLIYFQKVYDMAQDEMDEGMRTSFKEKLAELRRVTETCNRA